MEVDCCGCDEIVTVPRFGPGPVRPCFSPSILIEACEDRFLSMGYRLMLSPLLPPKNSQRRRICLALQRRECRPNEVDACERRLMLGGAESLGRQWGNKKPYKRACAFGVSMYLRLSKILLASHPMPSKFYIMHNSLLMMCTLGPDFRSDQAMLRICVLSEA